MKQVKKWLQVLLGIEILHNMFTCLLFFDKTNIGYSYFMMWKVAIVLIVGLIGILALFVLGAYLIITAFDINLK